MGRFHPNGTYSAIICGILALVYHAGRLEELLVLNPPFQPGEDVKGLCLASFLLAGRTGKVPKRVPKYGHDGRSGS